VGLSALTGRGAGLEACSPALRASVERVGERSSELWLHLLGLALERPGDIAGAVRATPPVELRRHLAGVHVPAWRELVGADALEATARGDDRLLDHDRYYAGQARGALERLLPLTAAETKKRVLDPIVRYEAELLDPGIVAGLEREALAKEELDLAPDALVALCCPGYGYEPEPGLSDVALVPHRASAPWLLLCQHERTRIICYPMPEPQDVDARLLTLGRALADEHRIAMLRRLAAGEATLAELAVATGVAKSTAHHHLGQLRAAGLVEMRGNARGYRFALLDEGFADARRLLAG
jgi:DNA-binding transcriptional ArsR family regulator